MKMRVLSVSMGAVCALILGMMASSAGAASHCVTFLSQAPGSQVPFVTEAVNLTYLPFDNNIGFFACAGQPSAAATVVNSGVTCGPPTVKPSLIIDFSLVEFNMADYSVQLGNNPVKKLKLTYNIVQPNVQIMINGACVTNNNFVGIPGLIGGNVIGGVKYKAKACTINLKKKGSGPFINQFAIGGAVINIDDICARG